MTYDEAALIEPLAVTVHAAKRFPDINGANVSIIGCGPIGILLMQSCKALGAAKVLITDISDYRLEPGKVPRRGLRDQYRQSPLCRRHRRGFRPG